MSSVNLPFGLRPVTHQSAAGVRQNAYTIAAGYATPIFFNSPVALATDGTVVVAGVTGNILGAFRGCTYIDAEGRPVTSNRWPGTAGATNIVAFVSDDPDQIFEIQNAGSVAQLRVGEQGALAATPGSGTALTGYSTAAMSNTLAATANQLAVIGFGQDPDNAVGDAFTVVRVKIMQHPFRAGSVVAAGV